jgi:hypothetical protein
MTRVINDVVLLRRPHRDGNRSEQIRMRIKSIKHQIITSIDDKKYACRYAVSLSLRLARGLQPLHLPLALRPDL